MDKKGRIQPCILGYRPYSVRAHSAVRPPDVRVRPRLISRLRGVKCQKCKHSVKAIPAAPAYNLNMSSNWVGKTLGKVRIESLLARGGAAEVYIGTHITLDRTVAVKILHNLTEENTDALERFQREAKVVAKLRHPNIVQVFDFDTADNDPYLVMEYIQGPSLSRYLRALHQKGGRLELSVVAKLLTAIAGALQYAHKSGIVHRDIKPGNILLTSQTSAIIPGQPLPEDFEPVLTDFGLVRFLDSNRQTTTGAVAGTPAYMSPEQARGETTDGRTDVYSLGIVLYELLAGHLPFDGETTMSILLKHVTQTPAPIPGLSPYVQAVLDRVLAKDVKDRFQTPNELAYAFEAVSHETAELSTLMTDALHNATPILGAVRSVALVEVPALPKPQKRRMGTVLASVAILITTGAAFLFNGFSSFSSSTPTVTSTVTTIRETNTAVSLKSSTLGQTVILQLRDGSAVMDQAILSARGMPSPPAGSQYEAWLIGDEQNLNLGILSLDGSRTGKLIYKDAEGLNLLSLYDQALISLKPVEGSDPEDAGQVIYTYSLPTAGLEYVRSLLVSYSSAPGKVAIVQGLYADTQAIVQSSEEMSRFYEKSDLAGTRKSAQAILNLLAGNQSPDYKSGTNPQGTFGFFLNEGNLGYVQEIYAHADYAVNAPGASQNMITNGEIVKVCAQNLDIWASQLRDQVKSILNAASLAEMDQPVRYSALLADTMLNGSDKNSSGEIEPVSGECGVMAAYRYAYQMADMPLLPVGVIGTPAPGSTAIIGGPTNSSGTTNTGGGATAPPVKPKKTPPGQDNKPPKNDGGGGNGNGNGNGN